MNLRSSVSRPRGGYILMELVIALTIFALSALGLATSLNAALEASNRLQRDNTVRLGLRAFVEELRIRELRDMTATVEDPTLGVTYTSTVEPVDVQTEERGSLDDLYNLQATASYEYGGERYNEEVNLYVYKPSN